MAMRTDLKNGMWARCFVAVAASGMLSWAARGNPTGATVTQGSASFNGLGTGNLTITTSANAFINWQSFDILGGQTTTFNQPSSSSVVWNQINSPAASQILGTLNANGYVILQNPNGFYVGGSASISAHGLVMTTASPSQMPDLSSAGAWVFNAAPPLAKIINYGTISVDKNSSAFLIANDVENNGSISAPQGNIGLYAGQSVLVSTRPDGRGLSARVTLPAGSVDNTGKLTADGGSIVMQAAQVVNNGGTIQANAAANVNGVIELLAGNSLTLSGASSISATGDSSTGNPSPGGFVVLKSDGTYSDTASSTIDVSGANGGQNGIVEVFGTGVTPNTGVDSVINNPSVVLRNPDYIALSTATDLSSDTSSDPLKLSASDLANYGQIDLFAVDNITVLSSLSLVDPGAPATLSLWAGNNITLSGGTKIAGGNNWDLNLSAGNGIDLAGSATTGSFITTANGDIDLYAGKEVQVGSSGGDKPGTANSGISAIATTAGGNISVTAVLGDVNTGSGTGGYNGSDTQFSAQLGGISTERGGNVTITAGGNVTSFLPSGKSTTVTDAGTGAFGTQPGNVTITAGGSVYGHYVEGDGVGSITAENGNVGSLTFQNNNSFALSLISGSWDVEAPNGSIYLQEVRNPNGDFDFKPGARQWLFDYSPTASVSLNAGNAVAITGGSLPRISNAGIPIILPPSLEVTAGAGGFTLYPSVTLFQSPYGNLDITTLNGGSFIGIPSALVAGQSPENPQLFMSDSGNPAWSTVNPMTEHNGQHAATPPELNNPNPVVINVSGNLNNVDIYTTKETQITVAGNMNNANFIGENLHPTDVSFVDVAGQIFYSPYYSFETLNQGINPIPFGPDSPLTVPLWDSIFYLMVDPAVAASLVVPSDAFTPGSPYYGDLSSLAPSLFVFPTASGVEAANPGFIYNSSTLRFGYGTPMLSTTRDWLNGWNGSTDGSGNKIFNTTTINGVTYGQLSVLEISPTTGLPVVQNGKLQLETVTFVSQNAINSLYAASQNNASAPEAGIQIGGPGKLLVNAGSLDLGDSEGIESWGVAGPVVSLTSPNDNYNTLLPLTAVGASVNVNVAGNLDMLTSRIASMFGGEVTVTAGGSMDLGSAEVPPGVNANAYGVYTTGGGDVKVTAIGDINIDGSRIATYNGGTISVESYDGNVDVGSGGNTTVSVPLVSTADLPQFRAVDALYYFDYPVYGSGVVATSLPGNFEASGRAVQPANIEIDTPKGNITASDAGVLQYALDGSTAGGPTITLTAGTPAVTDGQGNIITPAIPGNIDLGHSGIIGGTVNLAAQGDITGVIISRQNSTVDTSGNFSGTLLSGGTAGISAGGSISGTVVGIGGVNASGGSGVSATLLGQNVSVNGGSSQSTLGTATATATSSSASSEASDSSKQQVASNGNGEDDEKKKKGQAPALTKRSSRVTVILPKPM